MGTIFVVSPCYLEAMYKESSKYNFNFQGYGSFALANEGLMRINKAELLGFAFVGIHLPLKHTKEYRNMKEFFKMCELMHANKKFIVATDEPVDAYSKLFKEYEHIRFIKAKSYDFLSDIVINQSVFGSILIDNGTPYQLKQKQLGFPEYSTPQLQYIPLFTDAQMSCLSDVECLDTLFRTLQNDAVYKRFVNEDSDLQYFRKYMICRMHGNSDDAEDCRAKISQIIADEEAKDAASWCTLQAMQSRIEEVTRDRVSEKVSNITGNN